MKTRLALLTIAFMSVFAYAATTWKADESTPTAPGSTLIDDEALTVKTVFETSLKSSPITIAGEEFTHFIQVRNANLPSTEKPDGTEQEGSTSLVVTAKKDVTLTVYYRRQPANDVYESNDGKDLKLYNRADMTLMNGILTLDSKTEDEKFGFVTKVYELTEGASYTFSAKGTTIQFFGLKAEVAEPPVPTIGEAIEISPASGTDIAAELATAMGSNPYPAAITINLAAGGAYTVGQAIPVSGALTIKGDDTNPAVIDATALSSAMIAVNTTLPESLLDESGFYKLGDVLIQGVKVNGLPAQLFFANGQKCLIQNFTLDNSVIEVNGGSKNTIDFAGGGVVADLKVTNSTIYSLKAHTGSIYSSQSGQKATEAGLEAQYFTLANSTFYNMANGKNTFTHRQSGQKWLNFTITNCVSIDTGKSGQFIKGMNGGQASANPVWNVSGLSSLFSVEGVLTDVTASESTGDEAEPMTNPVEGLIVFTGDYKAGDFTMGDCPQNEARIGDPRWLTTAANADIVINVEDGQDITTLLDEALAKTAQPTSITINVAADAKAKVSGPLNVSCQFSLTGSNSTIDASALTGPMILVGINEESTPNEQGFYDLGDVLIEGVKVNGLPAQLFFANGQKCLIQNFTLDNSVIEVNGGSKNTIDFAGGGVVADLKVTNSTIYSLKAHTGSIYSSQSGQKATEAGLEAQYFTLANSTFYNMANGKNTFTHRQSGQKWLNFTITNCVSIDTGKSGQFIKGMNGGQASANPVWNVSGLSSLFSVEGVLTDVTASESTGDEAEPMTNPVEGLIVFTGDYKAGDFTMGDCPQNVARIGDPRWLGELSELTIAITDESGYATYFNSEYAYTMPEGLLGATVVQVRGDQSYLNFIYKAGDVVPAGTPLLLQGAVKTYTAAVSTAEGVAPEANLLKGCDAFTAAEDDPAYFYYKLSRSTVGDTKKLGFFWFNADGHKNLCELNKAYLQLNAEQSSNFFINFQDEADGIADVKTSAQGTQEVYTLTGVKVNSERLTKGIYIINGKKTVVK